MEYDIAVIGAGLIGSAASKHISILKPESLKVCLIGPDNNDVSGSHGAWFDEGRITRIFEPINPYWMQLSTK